jgi:hypothetical protein
MQLHAAIDRPVRVGAAMKRALSFLALCLVAYSGCSKKGAYHPPRSGTIEAEPGGVAGYQHGIDRSKFVVGAGRQEKNEFGFTKVVGSEGTFAVDVQNGLAVALLNAHSQLGQVEIWYTKGPEEHNQVVMEYFAGAGIPRNQIAGVHATMSLTGSPNGEQMPRPQPNVAGFQSIIARTAEGIPVVDSVAWGRMHDSGEVIAEWVYWPAIPAAAVADAKKMRAMLRSDADRSAFIAKLPANLPAGNIVIRHSSASTSGPFEAFASYDVPERRFSSAPYGTASTNQAVVIMRHFDISGRERSLPQERIRLEADYPVPQRPAPSQPQQGAGN